MAQTIHSKLSRRERQIMDILYRRGRSTAGDVMNELTGNPNYSTVRTQLRVLEEKGHVQHEAEGTRFVYTPTVPRHAVRQPALKHLVETFFGGSPEKVLAALIGSEGSRLPDEELDRLAQLIEKARKAGRKWNPILNTVLFDAVIKPSIVLILALATARFLHRRSASLRHLVLATGLASALALPLLGLVIPAWQPQIAEFALDSLSRMRELPHVPTTTGVPIAAATMTTTRSEIPPTVSVVAPSRIAPASMLLGIWICGVLAVTAMLLVEIIKLARVAFRSETVYRQSWRDLTLEVSRQLHLKRQVRLIRNPDASLLGTWGVLSPRVLLPRESAEWSSELMRVVLGHELAHVKRNDWIVQIVAEAARAIYWFNPLFWMACSALRLESEHACDNSAIRLVADGPTYAAHVLEVVRTLNHSRGPGSAALAMAGTSNLEKRLVAVLNPTLNRRSVTNGVLALMILIAGGLTFPLAAMHSRVAAPAVVAMAQSPPAPVPSKITSTPAVQSITPTKAPAAREHASAVRASYREVAQSPLTQISPGSISGLVLDGTGARIPGVAINAAEASSGKIYRTLTNDSGAYNLTPLAPGNYSMAASLPGFQTSAFSAVRVLSGQNTALNVTLAIGVIHTTVEVSTPGLTCFSVFGAVKADGTPFTQADCPGGTAVYPAGAATQQAAVSRPFDDVVFVSPPTVDAAPRQNPIRIGGDLQIARRVSGHYPEYPAAARAGGIEGVVVILGVIAKDGTMKSLQIISSTNTNLNQSAIDAVQQWTYKPTLLNNEPVESMIDITVNYSLRR